MFVFTCKFKLIMNILNMCVTMYFMRFRLEIFPDIQRFTNKNYYHYYKSLEGKLKGASKQKGYSLYESINNIPIINSCLRWRFFVCFCHWTQGKQEDNNNTSRVTQYLDVGDSQGIVHVFLPSVTPLVEARGEHDAVVTITVIVGEVVSIQLLWQKRSE